MSMRFTPPWSSTTTSASATQWSWCRWVVMIRAGEHLVLSLWDAAHFEEEVGPIARAEGVPQVALAHNVATRDEVGEPRVVRPAATGADDLERAGHQRIDREDQRRDHVRCRARALRDRR